MTRSRGMWSAFVHPDFRRLAASAAASQVGDWLYNVALAVYAYEKTHSAAWIGTLTLMRLIPYVALAPIGGVIADRYERRTVLIVSDVLRTALMAGLALAVAADAPILVAGALALATTAAGTAYLPAMMAMVPDVVGEDDLGAANSVTGFIQSVSIVAGPALGGVLLAVASPTWSFVANAATFAIGGALTASVRTRSRPDRTETAHAHPALISELAAGGRVLAQSPAVRVLFSLGFAVSFVYGVQTVVLVIMAGERVGHSAASVGFLYVALGLGGVIGAPLASRLVRRDHLGAVAAVAMLATSGTLIALLPVRLAPLAFAIVLSSGVGQIIVDVVSITLLQRSLTSEVVGRVFGLFDAIVVGAMIAGSLLVAPLRNAIGLGPMLAVVTIVGPLLVLAQVRPLVDADRDAAITMAHISRAVDDLRRVALFANLHESGLERLARGAEKVRFAVGDTIIREGDAADACYTVLYGSVAVRRGDADGEIVAKLETDDFFGEIGLLRATARTATVTAAGDCVLYAISADAFRAALDADAMTSSRALEAATGRLAALRDRRPAGAGR